jgi:hypothetical protein
MMVGMTTMIPEQIQAIPIEKRTWRQHDRMALHLANLDEAELLYRQGRVSEDDMIDYLRRWNAGPHFTQAVFFDGRIRNFDPTQRSYPPTVEKKYGVRR